MNETIRTALQAVAPTLATALFGPLGGVAATIAGRYLLGRSGDQPSTVEEIIEAVRTATPETLNNLRSVETELRRFEQEMQFQFAELEQRDRADARKMAVSSDSVTPRYLAIGISVVWCATMLSLYHFEVPGANRDLASRAMGTLDAMLAMAWTFYFGSTTSSRMKDTVIAANARREESRAGS